MNLLAQVTEAANATATATDKLLDFGALGVLLVLLIGFLVATFGVISFVCRIVYVRLFHPATGYATRAIEAHIGLVDTIRANENKKVEADCRMAECMEANTAALEQKDVRQTRTHKALRHMAAAGIAAVENPKAHEHLQKVFEALE